MVYYLPERHDETKQTMIDSCRGSDIYHKEIIQHKGIKPTKQTMVDRHAQRVYLLPHAYTKNEQNNTQTMYMYSNDIVMYIGSFIYL